MAVILHKISDTDISDDVQTLCDTLNSCKYSVVLVGDFNISILQIKQFIVLEHCLQEQ